MQLYKLQTKTHINTAHSKLLDNIAYASSLGIREFQRSDMALKGKPVAIVGSGPSLEKTWQLLKNFPGDIIATNAASDYLVERGIIPSYHMIIDAEQKTAKYVQNPNKDIIYIVASQCDKLVFDALQNYEKILITLYQDIGEPIDGLRIGGGCMVGMRALYFSAALGYRDYHLFGIDSCFSNGDYYVTGQQNSTQDNIISVFCNDREFKCTVGMAHQANDFKESLVKLGSCGLLNSLEVYGDSLLKEIWEASKKIAIEKNKEKYARNVL